MHRRYRQRSTAEILALEPLEEEEQITLFRWAAVSLGKWPQLRLMFAVPNGMHSSARHVKRMKAAGLRPGVPDVWLPVPMGRYHGLVIEMKRRDTGRTTEEQDSWISELNEQGYLAVVCHGWLAARAVIEQYLGGDHNGLDARGAG